jgi:hypothetical protein
MRTIEVVNLIADKVLAYRPPKRKKKNHRKRKKKSTKIQDAV